MKFSVKLVGFTTIIIAILFSIGGFVFVQLNFNHSLAYSVEQNISQHVVERYSIESNIVNTLLNNAVITDAVIYDIGNELTGYLGFIDRQIGIYSQEGEAVFSSVIPELSSQDLKTVMTDSNEYIIRKYNDQNYMLISSSITTDINSFQIVSVFNIYSIFAERDRQMKNFIILDFGIILISVIVVFIFSLFLTAPIKRLNYASKKIAKGAYSERTKIKSTDEIGELSTSFNCMADAIETKIQELNDAVKARDDFVASFTHELKTPMTAIVGYADMLRTMECEKEIAIKAADYIFNESRRLQLLSLKLMDLILLTNESISIAPLELKKFFRKIEMNAEQITNQIVIVANIEAATVLADESLLNSLIQNLITNAKKSNPSDRRVTINGRMAEGKYEISVQDKGCGISADELPRITEPFFMADKTRSRDRSGSGLGLYIAEKIACLHQTALTIESEVNIGTTVRFWLEVKE